MLPEQVSAARPVGAPRRRKAERRQVSLRPISLEDLLPPDHRARFVWAFAERLDLSALYGAIKAVEGRPGHPPADPRLLLALWLYATVEGVGSARELDRLCREHTGFEWLCGGVGMNHTTLADFRIAHGAVLERLLVDSVAAMLKCGHASLERVAQDGMRVRAAAGAAGAALGAATALRFEGHQHYLAAGAVGVLIGFYDGAIGPGTGSARSASPRTTCASRITT
jgi:transposase